MPLSRLRWLLLPLVILPVGWLLFTGLGHDPRLIPSPLVGKPMPAFAGTTLDGSQFSSTDLAGKPAIVNFWASYCIPSCVDEHPVLLEIAASHSTELQMVGVLVNDTADGARGFLDRYGQVSWPTLLSDSPERSDVGFRRKEELSAFPLAFELGYRDGEVLWFKGALSGSNLELFLHELTRNVDGIQNFDKLPIPYRAVATNMITGKEVVFDSGRLYQAMRASMSVPGMFAPVEIEGRILGDGGGYRFGVLAESGCAQGEKSRSRQKRQGKTRTRHGENPLIFLESPCASYALSAQG